MSEFTTFSENEAWALRRLVNIGIHDFEIQISRDPRIKDHLEMPFEDHRAMHAGIKAKLAANTTIDARLFSRDETQFIAHLAQSSIDLGGASPDDTAAQDAEQWESRIVTKAHHMNEERRATDFSPTADAPAEPSVSRPDRLQPSHTRSRGTPSRRRRLGCSPQTGPDRSRKRVRRRGDTGLHQRHRRRPTPPAFHSHT